MTLKGAFTRNKHKIWINDEKLLIEKCRQFFVFCVVNMGICADI